MSESRLGYRPALDGLRAVAVLSVIAYHLGYGWAGGGFLGVDVFFVLSGYLITGILFRTATPDGKALLAFWSRRIRRLLPALLLVLGAVAFAAVAFVPATEVGRLRFDSLASLFYFANWRFIWSGQSYFDLFSAPSPLRHLWSLAIEEQFYLVWPLVTLAALRFARNARRVIAIVCVVGIAASVTTMALVYDSFDPSRAYYGTDARIHSLLVGCLLALVFLHRRPAEAPNRNVQLLSAALAIVTVIALAATDVGWSGFYRGGSLAFAVLVASLIATTELAGGGPVNSILGWKPIRWVGLISYGLYLWHWPLIVWLTAPRVGFGGWQLDALRIAATFAAATVSFYLVEQPIRRGTVLRRGRRRTFVAWPASIAACALVLVAATSGAEALPTYLTGTAGSACGAPLDKELATARTALRTQGRPAPAPGRQRILVVGDSTACSMYLGLSVVGNAVGVRVDNASIIGCGIVSDEVSVAFFATNRSQRCHDAVQRIEGAAFAKHTPDLVVWASSFERASIVTQDGILVAGTPAWRAELLRRMNAALARFTAAGERVVIVSQPSFVDRNPGASADKYMMLFPRLNELLRQFAHEHSDRVTYADLAGAVCPSGPPCPRNVAGIALREVDGAHYVPTGSVWVARWLLSEIAKTQ